MTPAEKLASGKAKPNGKLRRAVHWKCRIREMRDKLNLSLRDIERGTGITSATLSHAERGCDLNLTAAAAIAGFFGVKIEDIWYKRIMRSK